MMEVIVTRKWMAAERVAAFELMHPEGEALPQFAPGAHIEIELAPGLLRHYSLYNACTERHRYCIGVLRENTSRGGSAAMHEQVHVGGRLRISAPRNHFPLESGAAQSALLAGGIGITPMLCMAEALHAAGADFVLHYCARSVSQAAFVEHLRDAPFASFVRLHFDDQGEHQRLDLAASLGTPAHSRHLYVCGPGGFMEYVIGHARQTGWTEANIHREYFSAGASPETAHDAAFEVQIASTGLVIAIPADRSVAQALLAQGIDIPLSCEQGVCGTCLTRVLEGEPDHRDMFLTDAEKARNDQFTPCCSRARSTRLVLDL